MTNVVCYAHFLFILYNVYLYNYLDFSVMDLVAFYVCILMKTIRTFDHTTNNHRSITYLYKFVFYLLFISTCGILETIILMQKNNPWFSNLSRLNFIKFAVKMTTVKNKYLCYS